MATSIELTSGKIAASCFIQFENGSYALLLAYNMYLIDLGCFLIILYTPDFKSSE